MGISEISYYPLVLTSPLSTNKERQMRRDISEKNNGLLKENSNNQEIQRQTGQRPRTNAEEIPLFVPGNTDKMVKNPLPGPRSREREWRKQHGKRAPVVQKLPPILPLLPTPASAKWITNGEQGQKKNKQKTWINYFRPKAVSAAVLSAPTRASPGRQRLELVEWLGAPGWRLRANPAPPR